MTNKEFRCCGNCQKFQFLQGYCMVDNEPRSMGDGACCEWELCTSMVIEND